LSLSVSFELIITTGIPPNCGFVFNSRHARHHHIQQDQTRPFHLNRAFQRERVVNGNRPVASLVEHRFHQPDLAQRVVTNEDLFQHTLTPHTSSVQPKLGVALIRNWPVYRITNGKQNK
jgi:hypothetical protein